jgi:hypothetical protein
MTIPSLENIPKLLGDPQIISYHMQEELFSMTWGKRLLEE